MHTIKTETPGQLEPVAIQTMTLSDGAVIRLRRHGNKAAPRLALSHGNGLAIGGYSAFWQLLVHDFDVVLFDMRNHGQNPLHDPNQHHWKRITQDMGEIRRGIDRIFGSKPAVGVFHSMSAIAALKSLTSSTVESGSHFDALVLFDPPMFPPVEHVGHEMAFAATDVLATRTRRRPTHYDDPMDLALQFQRKSDFSQWVDGAAEDMARATLVGVDEKNAKTQTWRLACPRELEARMYETNRDPSLWMQLTGTASTAGPAPFKIIGADPEIDSAQAPALMCKALSDAAAVDYEFVVGTSHFMQIEKPTICAERVCHYVATQTQSVK